MKNLSVLLSKTEGGLLSKKRIIKALSAKRGDGFLDVLIKILITVIIGAALLALLRTAIPDLFQDILNKIQSVFIV